MCDTKESMDMVGDLSLLVTDVTVAFGCYLKYHVRSSMFSSPTPATRNTSDVMMTARRNLEASASQMRHPPPLIVKNRRDQIHGFMIRFMIIHNT